MERKLIIPIAGRVDAEMVETVAQAVAARPDKIDLVIDSDGGSAELGLAIFFRLTNQPAPVSAHVFRRCRSSAITILCAAERRTSHPNAKFLLHSSAWDISDRLTADVLERKIPELRDSDQRIREIIVARTGCSMEWLQNEEGNENETALATMVQRGLINEVIL